MRSRDAAAHAVFGAALCLLPLQAGAQSTDAAVEAALRAPTLAGAHVAILALDTQTGNVLYARNADDDVVPASTLKLLVGYVALLRLGPQFAFTTEVVAARPVENGVLNGNLYLRGGGDPELSLADLNAAASAVAGAGIRRVTGTVAGDSSRYAATRYPGGWNVDDVPYEYAAVPSALSVGLNVAHVRVVPGTASGQPTTLQIQPRDAGMAIENDSVTGAAGTPDTIDVMRPWDRPGVLVVTGSYPAGAPPSDDLEPALVDPPEAALRLFAQALTAHDVTVANTSLATAPAGATVLWSHPSKPLRLLLRDFLAPELQSYRRAAAARTRRSLPRPPRPRAAIPAPAAFKVSSTG